MASSLLIVGGAGFIGSHLTRYLSEHYPDYRLIHLDKMSSSGCQENVNTCRQLPLYFFEHGDALVEKRVVKLFQEFDVRGVIYLAGASASEATLANPKPMIDNNIQGILTVLEVARQHWMTPDRKPKLGYEKCPFHFVSTAHVYGHPAGGITVAETAPLRPLSLYAASQVSAEMIAQSYCQTYGMNISISRLCTIFGGGQFGNRFIPTMIQRALDNKNLTIKSNHQLKQSWLYIDDCVRALDALYHHGKAGSIYNVGSNDVYTNLEIVRAICSILDIKKPMQNGRKYESLLRLTEDENGVDAQIVMDCARIREELGWTPQEVLEVSLVKTVDNYLK